jgi:hypothetical protein
MKKWDMKSFTFSDFDSFSDEPDVIVTTYKVAVEGTIDRKDMSGTYNCGSVWKKEKGRGWRSFTRVQRRRQQLAQPPVPVLDALKQRGGKSAVIWDPIVTACSARGERLSRHPAFDTNAATHVAAPGSSTRHLPLYFDKENTGNRKAEPVSEFKCLGEDKRPDQRSRGSSNCVG